MKKNVFLYAKAFLLAMTMAVMPSCSDDDDEFQDPEEDETVSGSDIDASDATVEPGGTYEFTFEVGSDWTLSSDALWCVFSDGMVSMSGSAGSQIVTVSITDDGWTVEESTAEITLTVDGESQVIVTITRPGMPLAVYDGAEGTLYSDENPVTVTYSSGSSTTSYTTVSLYANFAWTLAEIPEWLTISESLPTSADAYQLATISLAVDENYIVDARTDSLVLRSQSDEERTFSVPVVYAGMEEGQIVVKFNNATISNAYNWIISQDGQTFWQENTMSDTEPTVYNFPLSMTVRAVNNNYKVVKVAEVTEWGSSYMAVEEGNEFYAVTDDGAGDVSLGDFQSNDGSARTGFIMIMPDTLYTDVRSSYCEYMFVGDDNGVYDGFLVKVNGNWRQVAEEDIDSYADNEKFRPSNYVRLAFEQEGESSTAGNAPYVYNSLTYGSFSVSQGYGDNSNAQAIASMLIGASESEMYYVTVSEGTNLGISLPDADLGGYIAYDFNYNEIESGIENGGFNYPNHTGILVYGEIVTRNMVIGLYSSDGTTKALVVYVE